MNISLSDFEKNFQLYWKYIKQGKDIYLTQASEIVALVSPVPSSEKIQKTKTCPFGLAKGSFVVPNDFNEPVVFTK